MQFESSLQHWGIKGMKWGIRRYQNKDGSLTPAGRKRYSDTNSEPLVKKAASTSQKKSGSSNKVSTEKEKPKKGYETMSDAELELAVRRLELEKRYRSAAPKPDDPLIPSGKTFMRRIVNNSVVPAIEQAAKNSLAKALEKGFDSILSKAVNSSSGSKK